MIEPLGSVWAAGNNNGGQLGDGTTQQHEFLNSAPVPIPAEDLSALVATVVTAIAAGAEHSVALGVDGTVWVWGWNNNGQLGDGSTKNRSTADLVKLGPKVGRASLK